MSDTDLLSLVTEYANKAARRNGTSVKWVKINGKDLKKYKKYKTKVEFLDISYGAKKPITFPKQSFAQWFDNDTSLEATQIFKRKEITRDTFTYSFTEGIKAGVEISGTAGVPGVASVGVKSHVELSFSATQTKIVGEDKIWEVEVPLRIPPRRSVSAVTIIDIDKHDLKFTAELLLTGYVAIWFKKKIPWNGKSKHHLWFPSIRDVVTSSNFPQKGKKHIRVTSRGVIFTTKGTVKGQKGILINTRTTEYKLRLSGQKSGSGLSAFAKTKGINRRTIEGTDKIPSAF